jgi:hypothetical protein
MNISFAGAKEKGKKRSLEFGLNNRSTKTNNVSKNVFGDDDSSDDDDDDDDNDVDDVDQKDEITKSSVGVVSGGRKAVNQQIVKEQASLRKRAQAAMMAVEDPSMYDYDGVYDTFKSNNTTTDEQRKRTTATSQENRKSKYVGDLLKAAKVRERERDAIYERRIAKEQAEEDAKDEYSGKEKFVSKAYKRKLEERRQWEQEQDEKEREEAANDVTKKSAGVAFAHFYGNLNKNVAAGGGTTGSDDTTNIQPVEKSSMEILKDFDPRGEFMNDFERSTDPEDDTHLTVTDTDFQKKIEISNEELLLSTPVAPTMSMRERREKKVAKARMRYQNRKEAPLEQKVTGTA